MTNLIATNLPSYVRLDSIKQINTKVILYDDNDFCIENKKCFHALFDWYEKHRDFILSSISFDKMEETIENLTNNCIVFDHQSNIGKYCINQTNQSLFDEFIYIKSELPVIPLDNTITIENLFSFWEASFDFSQSKFIVTKHQFKNS